MTNLVTLYIQCTKMQSYQDLLSILGLYNYGQLLHFDFCYEVVVYMGLLEGIANLFIMFYLLTNAF